MRRSSHAALVATLTSLLAHLLTFKVVSEPEFTLDIVILGFLIIPSLLALLIAPLIRGIGFGLARARDSLSLASFRLSDGIKAPSAVKAPTG